MGCLGLGNGGVDFARFAAGVGGEQRFTVVDFVQVDLAQIVFCSGRKRGGGQHRSGNEQTSKSGTLHGYLLVQIGLDAAGFPCSQRGH